MPHMLWHREGSLSCHTCCDTGRNLYRATPAVTGRKLLYCATPTMTQDLFLRTAVLNYCLLNSRPPEFSFQVLYHLATGHILIASNCTCWQLTARKWKYMDLFTYHRTLNLGWQSETADRSNSVVLTVWNHAILITVMTILSSSVTYSYNRNGHVSCFDNPKRTVIV
jgi:hypothetical protein